jgi:hypothetical protein
MCFSCGEEAATFADRVLLSAQKALPPPPTSSPPPARTAPTARSVGGGGILSNLFGWKKDKDGGGVRTAADHPGQQLKTARSAPAVGVQPASGRSGTGSARGAPADKTVSEARGAPRRMAPAAAPIHVSGHVGWDEELGFSVSSSGPTSTFPSLTFISSI